MSGKSNILIKFVALSMTSTCELDQQGVSKDLSHAVALQRLSKNVTLAANDGKIPVFPILKLKLYGSIISNK